MKKRLNCVSKYLNVILLILHLTLLYSCAEIVLPVMILFAPIPSSIGNEKVDEDCLMDLKGKVKFHQAYYHKPYFYYQVEEYGNWQKFHCWFD